MSGSGPPLMERGEWTAAEHLPSGIVVFAHHLQDDGPAHAAQG